RPPAHGQKSQQSCCEHSDKRWFRDGDLKCIQRCIGHEGRIRAECEVRLTTERMDTDWRRTANGSQDADDEGETLAWCDVQPLKLEKELAGVASRAEGEVVDLLEITGKAGGDRRLCERLGR